MADININDATHKHIVTPTEMEAQAIIERRQLYKLQDRELARDWALTALACKRAREEYRYHVGGGSELGKEANAGRPFMSLPASLDQRVSARFGPKWHRDKKLKKKVWDMYPEFRLRDAW